MVQKKNGLGIASLVLGIFGTLTICCIIGVIPCFIGMVLGVVAISNYESNTGVAKAGLIVSVVGLCFFGMAIYLGNGGSTSPTEDTEVQESESDVIFESAEDYKASCKEYVYKEVLRNPENYVGERVKVVVKISTVKETSWTNDTKYYFARAEEDGRFFGGRYAIFDKRYDESFKILEDDIIVVYGEISEPKQTTSLIVNGTEVFCIDMRYMEFLGE